MEEVKNFLVQFVYEGQVSHSLLTESELIHMINMLDCDSSLESYQIYKLGEEPGQAPERVWYSGWQPDCLIEIVDKDGNVVAGGFGTDH